jgi:hypothetical protein
MTKKIVAYGVEIRFRDRDLITVPVTKTTGYMVSSLYGEADDLLTFGTFHKDLYLRWRSELDRAGREYVAFEPE